MRRDAASGPSMENSADGSQLSVLPVVMENVCLARPVVSSLALVSAVSEVSP